MTIKEIQTRYIASLYFMKIYLYLAQNKLPSSQSVLRQVETETEKYLLPDSLLFRIHKYYDEQNQNYVYLNFM